MAVALGKAARLAADALVTGEAERLVSLREDLHARLMASLPGRVHLNGPTDPGRRLPGTLNVSITQTRGHELLAAVPQLAASTGSACHSGRHTPSPVLTAMRIEGARALGALRLSLGRWSTLGDTRTASELLTAAAAHGCNG